MPKAAQTKDLKAELVVARRRGKGAIERFIANRDMLTGEEMARLLGVATEMVQDKLKKRELLGLEVQDHVVRYPRWQLDSERRPIEGLSDILARFGDERWAAYRFLTQHHAGLGKRTAIEALKAGRKDAVLQAADSATVGEFS